MQLGDIVYARRGDIGRQALVTEREAGWLCGTGCLRIRFNNPNIDSRYVSYYLSQEHVKEYVLSSAVGTTMPNLNTQILRGIPVRYPTLNIQKKIAETLGALDEKIEINQRMNQTLEDLSMALYRHWFIDFGPFQEGEFENSELGMIPKGWKVRSVYDLAEFINGKAFKQPLLNEQKKGLPVIKIAELNANSVNNAKYYEGEFQEKYKLNTGDVLFAWSASLGIHLWTHGEALLNQHIFNVQPNGAYSKPFLYFLLKNVISEFKEIAAARATTMGHITKEHLKLKYVLYPTKDFLEKVDVAFTELYSKILANEIENTHLVETRNYLLTRLLSGEIDFKEIEKKEVEGVL